MPNAESEGLWSSAGALQLDALGWLEPHPAVSRWASPHQDERPEGEAVSLLVVHSISLPRGVYGGPAVRDLFLGQLDAESDPRFESLRGLRVSSHFFIDREGQIHQFVSVQRRAWHAGVSSFQGRSGCNDFSVGVELEGVDDEAFTPAQEQQCLRLSLALADGMPSLTWLAGHSDIAPGRKTDPGTGWNWGRFQQAIDQALGERRSGRTIKYFFHQQI